MSEVVKEQPGAEGTFMACVFVIIIFFIGVLVGVVVSTLVVWGMVQ